MWASLSLLTILAANAYSICDCDIIRERFQEYMITPQHIPYPPIDILTSIFQIYRANLGNVIPQCATIQQPFMSFPNPDSDALYTLVGIVLPALVPVDTSRSTYVTQLVHNIPGAYIQDGDTVVPYMQPNLDLGGGLRRVLGLIYRQPEQIEVTADVLSSYTENRYSNFNITALVERYELGNPIAGNFFLGQEIPCGNQCVATTCGNNGCNNCCNNDCSNGYNNGYNNNCYNNGYNNNYNGNNDGCNDGYNNNCYNNGYNNNCAT